MVHVLVVTFNSQGHVNPMLRFAKRIAAKGLFVTFSTTADAGLKIRTANKSAGDSEPTPIGEGQLRFEFFSDGWGNTDSRRLDLELYMPHLKRVGSTAVANLIRHQAQLGRPVSYVINNPFVPWVLDIANEMGLPCGMLWVQSCAVFSTYYYYYHKLVEFPTSAQPNRSVQLPGIPILHTNELPSFLLPDNPYTSLAKVILEQFKNLSKASWVFVNSFVELEHETFHSISKVQPLIPVGPLIQLSDGPDGNSQVRADLLKVEDCMDWLDTQEPGSVVYASVGSVVVLSREEIAEMAHGFRSSKKPFLWVVRDESQELLPEGFVEETTGQGMVVSWSPQDLVLSHRSIACFLTHCGWNSTLECLTSGLPVIAFPQWGDQVTDAKFLVDVYKVGVHLRPRTTSTTTTSFTRGDVERSIAEVTEGPEAEEMKKNAGKWKKVARKAVAAGGSSDRNIQAFVEEMRRREGE